jgi:hypothetical protein
MDEGAKIIEWKPKDEAKAPPPNNDPPPKSGSQEKSQPLRMIQSSGRFTRGFVPPDYLVDGILQRRFCYTLTASTGVGKTAVMLRVSAHVALGRPIGNIPVEKGRVLYFAGENPDDIRMRWIGLSQEMGFDDQEIDVHFIPGTFKISSLKAKILAEMKNIGDFALVVVDTSAAYFEGDEANSNSQMASHARMLRSLCEAPGGPCTVVAAHPPKNATDDNLLPYGGGAFLNEVDGNLIAKKSDSAVAVHWLGKFRGPEFSEVLFRIQTVRCDRIKDSKGRIIPTVIAEPMGEDARDNMAATARSQEDALLGVLAETPEASQASLATTLGWVMRDGSPYKVLVARTLRSLETAKLIKKERDGYSLTPAGKKAVADLSPNPSRGSDD